MSQVDDLGIFTGIIRDLTERKKTEEALRGRRELSERLFIPPSISWQSLIETAGSSA